MKISISEIQPQEVFSDISYATAGEIVGGKTSAAIEVESSAFGDIAITKSDANAYSFSYESNRGKYSFSFAFGYALGFSFEKS